MVVINQLYFADNIVRPGGPCESESMRIIVDACNL